MWIALVGPGDPACVGRAERAVRPLVVDLYASGNLRLVVKTHTQFRHLRQRVPPACVRARKKPGRALLNRFDSCIGLIGFWFIARTCFQSQVTTNQTLADMWSCSRSEPRSRTSVKKVWMPSLSI